MPISCPRLPNDRQKKPFDKDERSAITLRAKNWTAMMRKAINDPRYDPNVRLMAEKALAEMEWQRGLSRLVRLSPDQRVGLRDLWASLFGQKNKQLGLNPSLDFSITGEVRENILDTRRTIEGMVSLAGRIESLDALTRFQNKFEALARRLRIPEDVLDTLIDETLTTGQIPRVQSLAVAYRSKALGNQTLVDVFQRTRYSRYLEMMRDHGIEQYDIDTLLNMATDVSMAFDRVASLARAVGVNLGNQSDIGYFSRQITSDFRLRLADLDHQDLIDRLQGDAIRLNSVHEKSRSTNHYIPADDVFVGEILGIDPRQIRDMLEDPLVWREYVHSNLTVEQLDMLIDAGVMQKLPMSSTEVFEYYVRQYDLPYEHLNEMFVTDPRQVLYQYTTNLMQSAGNSAIIQRMTSDEAFAQGWAITRETFNSSKDYANFVPLGRELERWASRSSMSQEHVMESLGLTGNTVQRMNNIYVHPIVAKQYVSMMAVSTSPAALNNIAGQLQYAGRWMTRRVLTSVPFVFRNILQGATTAVAAGGSMFAQMPSIIDMSRVFTHGLESLDNTRAVFMIDGVPTTKREAMRRFLQYQGHNVAPSSVAERFSGEMRPREILHNLLNTPKAFYRGMSHLWTYTVAHGDPVNGRYIPFHERMWRPGKKAASMLNGFLEDAFQPFAAAANFFDVAYKWSAFQTIIEKNARGGFADIFDGLQQILGSMQFKRFSSFKEAMRHIDQYFVNPYDSGQAAAFFNNYFAPFRTWAMANPPMQFRHMMRNPYLYLSYWRLRSLLNHPLAEDERLRRGSVPGWIQEGLPMFVAYDENGHPVVLLPSNFDGVSDAFEFVNSAGRTVNRLFGGNAGTLEQQLEGARGETLQRFFENLLSQSHWYIKVPYEQVSGREVFTGRPISDEETRQRPTLWGVPVHPRVKHIIENVLPMVRAVDQWNPGGVFGVAPKRDHNGQIIDPGKLSIFGTERTGRDPFLYAEEQNVVMRTLKLLGLQLQTIDPYYTTSRTLQDYDRTLTHLEREINRTTRQLRETYLDESDGVRRDWGEWERRRAEVEEQIDVYVALRLDRIRMTAFAQELGVTEAEVLDQIRALRLNLTDAPDPTVDQIREGALRILSQEIETLAEIERRRAADGASPPRGTGASPNVLRAR
jgi:hypothetical protein